VTDDPELAAGLRAFQAECVRPTRDLAVRYLLKFLLYPVYSHPYLFPYLQAVYQRSGSRELMPGATRDEEARGQMPPRYAQRLSNAQAALGLRQLRRLDANLAHRRRLAGEYRRLLAGRGCDLPLVPPGSEPAFVRFPIWVEDRAETIRSAAPWAVLGDWFTSVLEEAADPGAGGYVEGSCPVAESAARHLVNLPTHPNTRLRDARAIARAITGAEPLRPT
jgi:perosamine synthetase